MNFFKKLLKKEEAMASSSSSVDLDIPPPPSFNISPPEESPDEMPPAPMEQPLRPSVPLDQPSLGPELPTDEEPLEEASAVEEPVAEPVVEEPVMEDEPVVEDTENIAEEISESRERAVTSNAPVFTRVEDYKEILGSANQIKASLKNCEDVIKRINEIKVEEDKEYEKWKNLLLETYRKMNHIDKLCFEQKGE
ncbi:hypothetical protein H6504_03160 [Candidatus Woesearchaeota archaeon]|nr:hypothetical protein [Candidatus Woesearchaeota archaeon]